RYTVLPDVAAEHVFLLRRDGAADEVFQRSPPCRLRDFHAELEQDALSVAGTATVCLTIKRPRDRTTERGLYRLGAESVGPRVARRHRRAWLKLEPAADVLPVLHGRLELARAMNEAAGWGIGRIVAVRDRIRFIDPERPLTAVGSHDRA